MKPAKNSKPFITSLSELQAPRPDGRKFSEKKYRAAVLKKLMEFLEEKDTVYLTNLIHELHERGAL